MRRRSACFALALGLSSLVLNSGAARAQVLLQPRLEAGKYRREQTIKANQQFKTPVADLSGTTELTAVSSIEVGKPNEQGEVEVAHTTQSMKGKFLQQGQSLEFDSTNPNGGGGDGPVADAIRSILKRELEQKPVMVFGADGKIKSVKGIVEGAFQSEAAIKEEQQQLFDAFPAEAVKPGDAWERDERMDLGQGQMFKIKRKYEYVGTTPKFATVKDSPLLDKIRVTDLSIELAMREDAGMLIKVKKSDIKPAESEGVLLFDRALGRIVEAKHKMRATGTVALEIMNAEIGGDFGFTLETSAKEIK